MLLDRRHVISSCLLLLWSLLPVLTICPSECTCRLDDKGRRKVSCFLGDMIDPIPTDYMDIDMEIIEISAPVKRWNYLTLGSIFQQFKKLQEIHLMRSNIIQIVMHAFWGVPTLKVLNLSYNNLTIVFDHNFRGLVNLIELNLDDNQIDRLPSGAFKHLTELRILTLQRNYLNELVPRLFFKLTKLQVLKISGNPLIELNPEVFKDVLELRVFECRNCQLRRINTQIYHLLPYLTHLDLGNNRMQFIDSDEFIDLRRLNTLKLDGNQLPVVLEKTFINQINLRKLYLSNNRLAKITNHAFFNLTNLIELDIGYNKLVDLESISLMPISNNLKKLILSGNNFQMSVLRIVFHVLNQLNDLSISDMKLRYIPNGLPENLLRLNVSGNDIKNLTNLPKKLIALDISRNKLYKINDENMFERLEKYDALNLTNNTWNCKLCNIEKMYMRVNFSDKFANIRCTTPDKLNGKLLRKLKYENIPACTNHKDNLNGTNKGISLIIGGTSILLFLIFSLTFVIYSCIKRHATNRRYQIELDKKEKRCMSDGTSVAAGGLVVVDGRCILSENVSENPQVIFGAKGEINFKFPLDLTERKLSVSTIDEIKKDTQLHTLPNGTGI